ncbi:MAG: DUF3077 domain-containing protein [Pseudomonas qingdaonensis]|uniref:DUF3077 domain-containing protein n=1 Tax=Pseudomonas qingdaonensis TaxID=2056231 RepID=UPI003315D1F6
MSLDPSPIKTAGVSHFSTIDPQAGELFSVNPGVCVEDALEHASCLMNCVNQLTLLGATEENPGATIWAAHYLGEMAKAIIDDVATGLFRARGHA